MDSKTYVCIDLKSFYASVECRERGLDPLTANLVVADPGAHGEDDLPCSVAGDEGAGRSRALPGI